MIKDFFVWLRQNLYVTCDSLQKIFGDPDTSAVNEMMAQLAWYDPATQTGPVGEIFVLNRGLNHLKGAVRNTIIYP
jgi:hypothetical protein